MALFTQPMKKTLYFLFLLTLNSFAQTTNWQALSISDGLSHSYVYQIYQTKDGYIWISTNEGFNRYDGYNFKVYLPDDKNPFSISDIRLRGIFEDRKDRLWISSRNKGVNLFDRIHQKFYHCDLKNKNDEVSGFEIVEDADGNIWVGGGQCVVFKIELPKSWTDGYPKNADFTKEVKITTIQLTDDVKDVKSLFLDNYTLWAGQSDGRLFKIDCKTLQKTEVLLPSKSDKGGKKSISGIYKDNEGNVWVTQLNEGLYRIRHDKIDRFTNRFPDDFNYYYWMGDKGFLWVKTPEDQVFRVPIKEFPSTDFTKIQPLLYSKSKSYKTFIETPENTLFLGDVRGVKKKDNRKKSIKHLFSETDLTEIFRSRRGENFVSTGGATYLYKENEPYVAKPAFKEIERVSQIQSKNGDIWAVGESDTNEQMLLAHYTENLQFIEVYPLKNYEDDQLPLLAEDHQGNIWMATSYGWLNKFETKTRQMTGFSFKHLLPPLSDAHSGEVFGFIFGKDKKLWIGTEDGLVEVSNIEQKPAFKIFKKNENGGLKDRFIQALAEDPNNPQQYIWVGTKNFGLGKMDKKTGKCQFFTKNEGLPHNTIWGILEDNAKQFWVSGNRGLFRFNPANHTVKTFSLNDGLQGEVYNKKAYYKTLNGEMVFAGANGFNVINPENIDNKEVEPNLKIVEIDVNNQPVMVGDESGILERNIENTEKIALKYSQNTIKIFFSVLDYSDSENNIFRYQLEGLDQSLVEAGTEHSATYVALPIGSYTFKLYGSIRGGTWNMQPLTLQITVLPPFYRTWWAYLLYFLIVAYIVYRFYEFQINKVKLSQELVFNQKEKTRLAELDQMKTNFFANISHEFRTPLTLILSPLKDLRREFSGREVFRTMEQNAQRLLVLINQLLDLSKLEAGKMEIQNQEGDLTQYFNYLFGSFETMAKSKNIIFQYGQSHTSFSSSYDEDKLAKIITNLLSNAFKFTPENGRVKARVDYSPNNIVVKIQDFGIGIDAQRLLHIFDRFYQADVGNNRNYEGTGIGLALVKELVGVLNGSITVESMVGKGTTFTVVLPMSPAPPAESSNRPNEGGLFPASNNLSGQLDSLKDETEKLALVPLLGRSDESVGGQGLLLIVEDNPELRKYIRSIFEAEYQIIEANDGQEGIEKATEQVPDIVICDLMMPRLDGFGFCKAIKTNQLTSHIPVVMLTAKANLTDRLEGLTLGADDYIAKPFDREELQVRTRNLVKQRLMLQEKYGQKKQHQEVAENNLVVPSADEQFIQRCHQVLSQHFAESSFDVERFAASINISSVQLRRKLKALTGQSVTEYVRNFRLEKAAELLAAKAGTVSEIAYEVGFESLSYFSKMFLEKFNKNPSEWP